VSLIEITVVVEQKCSSSSKLCCTEATFSPQLTVTRRIAELCRASSGCY